MLSGVSMTAAGFLPGSPAELRAVKLCRGMSCALEDAEQLPSLHIPVPAAPAPSFDDQKYLQTLTNVPLEAKPLPFGIHCLQYSPSFRCADTRVVICPRRPAGGALEQNWATIGWMLPLVQLEFFLLSALLPSFVCFVSLKNCQLLKSKFHKLRAITPSFPPFPVVFLPRCIQRCASVRWSGATLDSDMSRVAPWKC